MDITTELRERAASYRAGGPSAEHTAALLEKAAHEIEKLRDAVQAHVMHSVAAGRIRQ